MTARDDSGSATAPATTPGTVARWPVEVDVTGSLPLEGRHVLRGWACSAVPSRPDAPQLVASCLAGGLCTSRYFDLQVPGHPGYSMAEDLARRGVVVVALDHPGIGESTPVSDLSLLTPPAVAAAHARALGVVLDRLRAGTLAPALPPVRDVTTVGVGHSMGGMLAVVQQAVHRSFDAVAVLGHGGDGLPGVLTDEERRVLDGPLDSRYERIAALARRRRRAGPPSGARRPPPGSFFAADVPAAVRDAFRSQQAELLVTCGLTSMVPGATDLEKAAITVPLFLAFGEHDLTDDPFGCLARYRAVTDATLVSVPGSAHCHNQSSNRARLWDRLFGWMRELPPAGGRAGNRPTTIAAPECEVCASSRAAAGGTDRCAPSRLAESVAVSGDLPP